MNKTQKRGGGPGKKSSKQNGTSAASRKPHENRPNKIIMTPNGNRLTPAQMQNYDEIHMLELNRYSNYGNSGNEITANKRRTALEFAAARREIQAEKEATIGERLRRDATEDRARAQAAAIARQERQRLSHEAKALNNCPKGPGMCGLSGGKKPRSTRRRKRR